MIRRLCILALLFGLVWAGVELWYGRLTRQLVAESPPVKKIARTVQGGHAQQDTVAGTATGKTSRPGTDSTGGSDQKNDYQIIVKRNIFGAVLEQEVTRTEDKKTEEPEPEKTTLKLTLLGTVSGNERDARAIIVDEKEKKQDIYQIGDAVQGALITEIKRGKVILDVDGKREFLVIKERKDSGGATPGMLSEKRDFSPPPSSPARTVPAVSRPVPSVTPHRRISFRQRRKETVPALDQEPPENHIDQDPEMEPMPGEEAVVE
jgi:type II secretory pathway component PulC